MILTTKEDFESAILKGEEIKTQTVFYTGNLEDEKPLRFDVGSYNPKYGVFAGILKGKEVWVGLKDAKKQMDWEDAKKWREKQGGVLPGIDELTLVYLHKDEINQALVANGGEVLKEDWYWSSSGYNYNVSWHLNLSDGARDYSYKDNKYYVRCFQLL